MRQGARYRAGEEGSGPSGLEGARGARGTDHPRAPLAARADRQEAGRALLGDLGIGAESHWGTSLRVGAPRRECVRVTALGQPPFSTEGGFVHFRNFQQGIP